MKKIITEEYNESNQLIKRTTVEYYELTPQQPDWIMPNIPYVPYTPTSPTPYWQSPTIICGTGTQPEQQIVHKIADNYVDTDWDF